MKFFPTIIAANIALISVGAGHVDARPRDEFPRSWRRCPEPTGSRAISRRAEQAAVAHDRTGFRAATFRPSSPRCASVTGIRTSRAGTRFVAAVHRADAASTGHAHSERGFSVGVSVSVCRLASGLWSATMGAVSGVTSHAMIGREARARALVAAFERPPRTTARRRAHLR